MSTTTEEQPDKAGNKGAKYKYALINLVMMGFLFWSIYNESVRTVVFWFYLIMMSAMVIFGSIALKEVKVGTRHIFNLTLQVLIIGTIIYGLMEDVHASKVAVLLLFLHVFQSVQAFLTKTFKSERRTEERVGAMHRKD